MNRTQHRPPTAQLMVQRCRQSTEIAWCSTTIVRGRQLFSFSSDAANKPHNLLCALQSRELSTVPQKHTTRPSAQGARGCQESSLYADSSGHGSCSSWHASPPTSRPPETVGCCSAPLAAQIGTSAKPLIDGCNSEQDSATGLAHVAAARPRDSSRMGDGRCLLRSVMGTAVEEGLRVLSAQQRAGQAQELLPLGHVRAPGEVVVLVLLDAVQDLPVQDQRRPAGTGGTAESWQCSTGDAASCVEDGDSSRWNSCAPMLQWRGIAPAASTRQQSCQADPCVVRLARRRRHKTDRAKQFLELWASTARIAAAEHVNHCPPPPLMDC